MNNEFTWIQRDGTPIHVRAMTDRHLLNTIRMLRRKSKQVADHFNRDSFAGVWDADDAKGIYWFEDDDFCEQNPTWAALQFERRVRGLEELAI